MRRTALLAAFLLTALASGQDAYSVDTAGGPLTLIDEVAAAFGLFGEAGAPELPREADRSDVLFRFAGGDRFGPDAVTLTVQRPAEQPGLEVLVNPDLYRDWPAALVHEAGLVLGLASGTAGLMQPLLSEDGVSTPQPEDIARLRELVSAVPGDLTGDGIVDFLDLLELAADFGRRGVNLPGDLDGDGTVTLEDLRLLRENHAFTEPRDRSAEAAADPEPATGPDGETGEPELPLLPELPAIPELPQEETDGAD